MAKDNAIKPKRSRKKKPRTEVSSDSDSDTPPTTTKRVKKQDQDASIDNTSPTSKSTTGGASDDQIKAAFSQQYMQRITTEFAEDLDKIRGADDFKGADSVEVLIRALRQGVDGWSVENMKRVVGETK